MSEHAGFHEVMHYQIIRLVVAEIDPEHGDLLYRFFSDRLPPGAPLSWLADFLLARADNLAVHGTALDQAHACFEGIALQSDAQVLVIIAQRAEAMEGEPEGRTHRLLVHLASVATAAMGEVRDPRLNLL
ncbi:MULTISPECIES: hypothetical protein [Pseudomonadota]|jgi:hypothetical protein|uniref:hypothetical protein n=1 Tax=Pseudomonadota TaxID=1224 RepID=UPI00076A6C80|nr:MULTISPECIES: hypothetical protein [Pseudomonadota]